MKIKNLGALLLVIICLFITGCGTNKTKEVATLDEFDNIASNKNFIVSDNMGLYSGVDYILESRKAVYEDIEIEMVKYSDSDYAKKALDNHIESFNLLRSTGAYEAEDKGKNYKSYELISNGRYMFSIRVEDTLIFGKVMLEDKEIAQEIIDELGY